MFLDRPSPEFTRAMVSNSEPKSCGEGQLPVLARQGVIPVRAASSAEAATQLHTWRYFNRDAKAKNAKFLVIFDKQTAASMGL